MGDANIAIPLNEPYLPAFKKYEKYLEKMYANKWLTNGGPLLQEFSLRLQDYLDVPYVVLTSNGTSALQLAYRLFNLQGNVVTTPYSFIATCNSADWVGLKVKFADIDPSTLNISPATIEKSINESTSAIVPVHTYGNPCDVNNIRKIAEKYKLKVIYDAAHAFGIKRNKKSILNHGNASAISFHATKLFHCIEGGALIVNNREDYQRAQNMINFGIDAQKGGISYTGFNGKMSEAHAAMGLAMLDDIDMVLEKRLEHYHLYKRLLGDAMAYPIWDKSSNQNAGYFPVLFNNKKQRDSVYDALSQQNIQSRAYFSPSLNSLNHFTETETFDCPVSELMVDRVLCLPLFYSLESSGIKKICTTIKATLNAQELRFKEVI